MNFSQAVMKKIWKIISSYHCFYSEGALYMFSCIIFIVSSHLYDVVFTFQINYLRHLSSIVLHLMYTIVTGKLFF
jgi:hypothetical protein